MLVINEQPPDEQEAKDHRLLLQESGPMKTAPHFGAE
jgi:hypothetical protein